MATPLRGIAKKVDKKWSSKRVAGWGESLVRSSFTWKYKKYNRTSNERPRWWEIVHLSRPLFQKPIPWYFHVTALKNWKHWASMRCSSWCHRRWSSHRVHKRPHLTEAPPSNRSAPIWLKRLVWQHCFLPALVSVWLPTVYWRKQDLQAVWSDANQQTQNCKGKRSDIFKETTANYDVPSLRVCAITPLIWSGFFSPE